MTRDIQSRFEGDEGEITVEVGERGVSIDHRTFSANIPLSWEDFDRLVAEVEKLRPLVRDAA